jgi:hypothetical protein
MKYWAYVLPDDLGRPEYEVVSEADIITRYYRSWVEQCKASRVPEPYTYAMCIQDWITVNWAFEVKDPNLVVIERNK